MKARHVYPLLFLLPGAMLAFLAAVVGGAVGAGVLWVFVFGDDTWPQAANTALMGLAAAIFVVVFSTLLWLGYAFGKRQEASGGVRRGHVVAAALVSIGLPVLVLLHQWSVGNLGPAA